MRLRLTNKQQLAILLKTISLTGLDGKGSKVSILSEVVIKFYKDNTVITYGFTRTYGLFFSAITEMDMEIDEEFTLCIPFIDIWKQFIVEMPGKDIILDKQDGKMILSSGDENTFYELNDYGTDSIQTYQEKPTMIEMDDGFYSNMSDTLYDKYSTIKFDAKKLLKAINPGKLISHLLVEMTIKEDHLGLSVGKLGGTTIAKHTTLDVPGIEIEEWEHEGTQTWSNSSGLHSVINTIAEAKVSNPRFYFIGKKKGLIVLSKSSDYGNLNIDLMFVLTPSTKDSNTATEEE